MTKIPKTLFGLGGLDAIFVDQFFVDFVPGIARAVAQNSRTMTSLARQLQAIRSDVTATLDKRKHEKVASLLFEPKEAAYQDYGTLHAIGQNGLEGLIRLDERFHKFESTLFSVSSKDVDRALLVCFLSRCKADVAE